MGLLFFCVFESSGWVWFGLRLVICEKSYTILGKVAVKQIIFEKSYRFYSLTVLPGICI